MDTDSLTMPPELMTESERMDESSWRSNTLPAVGTPLFDTNLRLFEALDWSAPMTQYLHLWVHDLDDVDQKNWLIDFLAHSSRAAFALPLLLLIQNENLNKLIEDIPADKQELVARQTAQNNVRRQYAYDLAGMPVLEADSSSALLAFLNHWRDRQCIALDIAGHAQNFLSARQLFEDPGVSNNNDTQQRRTTKRLFTARNEALFGQLMLLEKNGWQAQNNLELPSLEGFTP